MQKTIASLAPLREVLADATQRYLKFLSDIETPEVGVQRLNQLTQTQVVDQRRYRGFNLLADEAEYTPRNVQTQEERAKTVFAVEIALENPQGLLRAGMPADAVLAP